MASELDDHSRNKVPLVNDEHLRKEASRTLAVISQQRLSKLLMLPGELRNAIYDYVFTGETIFIASRFGAYELVPSSNGPLAFALLQTCRQVRYEARSSLYAQAMFQFVGPNTECELPYFGYSGMGTPDLCQIESLHIGPNVVYDIESCLANLVFAYSKDELKHKFSMRPNKLQHIHVHLMSDGLIYCEYEKEFKELVRYVFGKDDLQVHIHKLSM